MNIAAIIAVLEEIESRVEELENVRLDDTIYEDVEELLEDINDFIVELEEGNKDAVEYIDIHFLPLSTFELLAKYNGWAEAYKGWLERYETAKI